MTLLELKTWVNKLKDEDLKANFYVVDKEVGIAGSVKSVNRARADLYSAGEYDIPLRTKTEVNKLGLGSDEIDELFIAVPKGAFVIEYE